MCFTFLLFTFLLFRVTLVYISICPLLFIFYMMYVYVFLFYYRFFKKMLALPFLCVCLSSCFYIISIVIFRIIWQFSHFFWFLSGIYVSARFSQKPLPTDGNGSEAFRPVSARLKRLPTGWNHEKHVSDRFRQVKPMKKLFPMVSDLEMYVETYIFKQKHVFHRI